MSILAITQEQIERFSRRQDEPPMLLKSRKDSLLRFQGSELPHDRLQEWRYTRIQNLNLDGIGWDEGNQSIEVAALDGGSLPDSVRVMPLAEAMTTEKRAQDLFGSLIEDTDKITALHYAFINKGVYISIADGTRAGPLSITLSGRPSSSFSHLLIDIGKDVEMTILIESKLSGGFNTVFTEMIVGDRAKVGIATIQDDGGTADAFSMKTISLGRDSQLDISEGWFGNRMVRGKTRLVLAEEGASANLRSVFIGRGNQEINILTEALHDVPHTGCDIKNRGVLFDKGRSVFQGRIKITKEAQDTSSFLDDKTLSLSEDAIAHTIPSLEIDANDVKASHASTIGMIDEEQLFYMMSRGLSLEMAERLIVEGFLEEILADIPDKEIYKRFRSRIDTRLG